MAACGRCGGHFPEAELTEVWPEPTDGGPRLCAPCARSRVALAEHLFVASTTFRLERAGDAAPDQQFDPIEQLPSQDQRLWLSVARAVERLYGLVHFP